MKPFALKTLGIFVVSLVLAGCANISAPNENSSGCPKVDLAQISAAPESDVYFEQAAKIVQEQSQAFIGLTEANAELCAVQNNLGFRVGSRDGEFFALTMDYIPTRVTVDVEKNLVVKIQAG
jgi:hypothetical protein